MTKHYDNGQGNPLVNKPILDTLEEEGVDPIRIMAKFASGELAEDADQQLAAAKELAQYVHPKKRSLDVNKEIKASVTFSVVRFSDGVDQAGGEAVYRAGAADHGLRARAPRARPPPRHPME